jgi:hypothetical protein
MNLISRFKKNPAKLKQPQEYYCSNTNCLNIVALFSGQESLLTDDAYNNYADFFCMNCITEERYHV